MKYLREAALVVLLLGGGIIGWGGYLLYPWQMALVRGTAGASQLVTQAGWHWHWPLLETVHRMDRRRQVYLSPSLPWPGSGTPDVLARFLVSWQISDPERYEARLGSEAAANGKILAALKGALKTSRLPVRVETVPAAFSTLPTLRPDSLNSRLAQEGVRVLWLQSTSLRWPTRQMAIREGRATQEWKLALARLKMTAREDLARIRASYEKRRMAYRLLETMRVGRIVARGLSKVAAIEAPARRLDPGFYDFLVHYENERARMKRRVVNLKIGVPRTSLHAGSPVSGRSKAP